MCFCSVSYFYLGAGRSQTGTTASNYIYDEYDEYDDYDVYEVYEVLYERTTIIVSV